MRLALTALVLSMAASAVHAPSAQAIGFMLPSDRAVDPLAIRYHRVDVTIRERVAETRVEQAFRNHTNQVLEATYVFPVPEGAAVSGFTMWVNGRRQRGELLESNRARNIYEQIVSRMQDPGLVEHIGGNVFRARVFPIQPGSEQRVEIRFTQTLPYESGVVHYRYPLRTGGRAARTLEDMTVSANIVSRTPIRAVYSPSHPIGVSRRDEHHATAGYEATAVTLDEDFDLFYAVQDREVGLSLLTHRPQGEDGYFLAMVAPRTEVTAREIANKEVLFVFDTSGSMAGEKIERAKAALDYMLARLGPDDHFQIVRFSTDIEALFDGGASVPATADNVARARRFAAHFVAAGGTAIDGALEEAYRMRRPRRQGAAARMVVFLTDGMPTIGETRPRQIVDRVGREGEQARLFVFGVGDDVNTTFLDQLARRGRGVGDYFRDGREMERRLSAFYDRVAYPLLTDLSLSFPGLEVSDVYPRDLGHLYRGGQLFVVGRYRSSGPQQLRLTGRASHEREARTFAYDVEFPRTDEENDWLPRLWATRKIGFLLDEIRLRGEHPELRTAVVSLAQRFGIVTPYTSFLVVEDEAIPPGLEVDGRFRQPADRSGGARPVVPNEPAPAPSQAQRNFEGFDSATSEYDFEDDDMRGNLSRPSAGSGGGSGGGGARGTTSTSRAPRGGAGERGRRISRQLREMREAEQSAAATARDTRFVGGRTFRLVRGMWVDAVYRRGMPTIRVRYASEAYFALLRERPSLRRFFALGQRVTVTLEGGRAVIVDQRAPAGVSAADVARFLSGGRP